MEMVKTIKRKSIKHTPFYGKEKYQKPLYNGLKMDSDTFESWKPEQIDGWKYEWVKNEIISNEQNMKQNEAYVVKNIFRAYLNSQYFKNGDELFSEMKFKIEKKEVMRIPDICYLTKNQINIARNGINQVPSFIIEIVSTFDQMNGYEEKLREYFEVGVQCVWLVFPIFKEVKVYTSIRNCTICLEQDICSAAPALTDFELITDQIFE